MLPSTLFPVDRELLKPAADRHEPVLWLRRLVIASEPNSSAVIRDIPFRRGLNIVQTRQMELSGGSIAGHSVGKTLLVRLIRYTLGEAHFGPEETEERLSAAEGLESVVVVAHWAVGGADWIAVRPLRPADAVASYAVTTDGWEEALDAPKQKLPYRDFLKVVEGAILSGLPMLTLPRGRTARWLDVLAWLARDYQCGYRRANEWRHDDANSGPSLDREENSLIMQWVMGLMGSGEIELRVKHRELLNQRAKQKAGWESDQKRLDTLWPSLRAKLELSEGVEIVGEQPTVDSIDPVNHVDDHLASLDRLKAERVANSHVAEFEAECEAARDKLADADAIIRSCRNQIQFFEKQIEEYERDPLQLYERCRAEPVCWMRERARETADDPAAADHLADLRSELQRQRQTLSEAERRKERHRAAFDDLDGRLKAERERLAAEISGIDESIGRWKSFQNDVQNYQNIVKSAERYAKSLAKAERAIEKSLRTQDDTRQNQRREVNRLSDIYQDVLQQIFGKHAAGQIQVDGNGLQPIPAQRLGPAGAALSVMTTVLAFDVACVAASITGFGHHPRFLMHDSPREADMEAPLFRKLFWLVHYLETQFTDAAASFQYIVTTTTPPPTEFADENGPYIWLTLDARSDEGRLLGVAF